MALAPIPILTKVELQKARKGDESDETQLEAPTPSLPEAESQKPKENEENHNTQLVAPIPTLPNEVLEPREHEKDHTMQIISSISPVTEVELEPRKNERKQTTQLVAPIHILPDCTIVPDIEFHEPRKDVEDQKKQLVAPIFSIPGVDFQETKKDEEYDKTQLVAKAEVEDLTAVEEIQEEAATGPAPKEILHQLAPVNRLTVLRKMQVSSVFLLQGKKNIFLVRTPDENLLYTIEEENNGWAGYFCYGLRPFLLKVTDSSGKEVIRIKRPFRLTLRILPCHLQHMKVYSPPGRLIGHIQQKWSVIKPIYVVKNANRNDLFLIEAPCVTINCFHNVQFHIMRPDGSYVGATCKRFKGLVHYIVFSQIKDQYGIAFKKNLANEEKALLLAASLLFDYMYYDN